MSDPPQPRRQPPSPLVFSPENVLSPQVNQGLSAPSITVSMPFVRRHVTRRLKAAKAECDKELQRVTNNITAYFEERLRECDQEAEREYRERERERDFLASDAERDPYVFHPHELRTALQTEELSSDGGYEAEYERATLHSRHPSSSMSGSPASSRRQQPAPWDKPVSASMSASSTLSSSPANSTVLLPDAPITRKQSTNASSSRRLSRTIHIVSRPSHSGQSSRSTSRSRSPLPPLHSHGSFSEYAAPSTGSSNRRSSRYLMDDPIDPIMGVLYEIIGVATDVMDMTINQLTAQPKVCENLVQRIQNIGKTWDEHPDWQGRNWYVQVLLAVASLSRVLEWWEAEKQFWNFEDNDEELDEPLTFVMKPADEGIPPPVPTPTMVSRRRDDEELENFRLDPEDDAHLKISRTTSHPRRSRQEASKDSSAPGSGFPSRSHSKLHENNESARVLATERLRLQAETAQNQNIVMELSLDGEHFLWVNYAWTVVVGTEAEDLPGTRISVYLHPVETEVFRSATERLLQNDAMTLEARFRLRVEPEDDRDAPPGHTLYRQMEGKGMLMVDREDGQPSHTMWVVKPISPPQWEADNLPSISLESSGDIESEEGISLANLTTDATLPFNEPISTEPILCRICECQIPQWYFEKHSETCAETHRLEAEISECNESIAELRNTIRDLAAVMDRSSPATTLPEYRGMTIYSPSASPGGTSPLHHLFRQNKLQKYGVKKMQRQLLDTLDDILQVAYEVSIPSLKEEEAKEPIERQRLLSPGSERKMSTVRTWPKPQIEDPALAQLVNDAERVMRQKIDNVGRMQNTIRYSEKVWQEWEERIGQYLANLEEEGSSSGSSDTDQDVPSRSRMPSEAPSRPPEEDDHSSTTSEYAFSGENRQPSVEPTPMPSSSPMPTVTPPDTRPQSAQGQVAALSRQAQYTRSSTPSSVSSPLALAAPIVAPPSEQSIPAMSLDDRPSSTLLKTRKSSSSLLDAKSPGSPHANDKDGTMSRERSSRRAHRHSTANILTSPLATAISGPLSPRQSSVAPLSRTSPTSIKDFDIIKPISKGAFGSVFLAKKKATGDYYAIKVLKKADMIAKNQITNVKAERMILMKQAESPFVAKLYFTFQSKENLYLVMEYLNGGDCAALIKSLGSLPEEWTKNYIAEVVLGLEYLHQRGVVHRDLKPDNLLIDQHGHLKLTDFGLSRIGLLGRQTRDTQLGRPYTRYSSRSRPPSMDSAYLSSPLLHPDANDDLGEPSGSESILGLYQRRNGKSDSPMQSFATELTTDLRSHSHSHSQSQSTSNSNSASGTPPGEQKFVGTPDYLAPETILGLRGDDAAVDWWALGVITYEFLYGIPPFHAETPEKVFENILSGHIEWHEEWVDFSLEARDFMERLLTVDPRRRLGANGAEEVKAHPFFRGIEWDKVTTTEAAFIPQVTDPESTDYFDPRGAIPQLFHDDDQIVADNSVTSSPAFDSSMPPPALPGSTNTNPREAAGSPHGDDFGSFSFKNLPVLKQANDDMIRKLKTDQMVPLTHAISETSGLHGRRKSISRRVKNPPSVVTSVENRDVKILPTNPPSPATSTSSIASSPSRASIPPSTPGSAGPGHARKPSDLGAVERFKLNRMEGLDRRNTMPSRLRTASVSSGGDNSGSETWMSSVGHGSLNTPPSSVHSIDLRKGPDPNDRAVTCLLAEDNPITAKIIETLLIRLGCRCVVVADGSEAISVAMGDIKFDCILMDLHMPVLDGEGAAKYIRSTNSKNTNTPIIAVSAYSGSDPNEGPSNVFSGSLAKPLQKADLLALMRRLGFKTSTAPGGPGAKVTTAKNSS